MRVVGGRLRGRTLAGPTSPGIRPTADRLRESLFNILVHSYDDPITGARVLDLSPAPARSALKHCHAARRSRYLSTKARKPAHY